MPRQIIDTQTSRPRYVRRLVLTYVALALVAAVLIWLAFAFLGHHAGSGGGNGPPARVSWQPSITAAAPPPRSPKENPCCVA